MKRLRLLSLSVPDVTSIELRVTMPWTEGQVMLAAASR